MEFGLFHGCHVPRRGVSDDEWRALEHRRLLDEVEVAVAGDRLGFKYAWATEHHFLAEYSHLSANEVFLAYVAGRTERIHLGSGIFNLTPPVNAPARVAERVAMLDHLSGGRFEFGIGRGSSSTEYKGFGIPDGPTTKAMHDEALVQILEMFETEEYRYDGQYFSMPYQDDVSSPTRNVLPKPYSRPHPPLWIACGSPETFEKAGRMGIGALCFALGSPEQLAPRVEAYKKAVAECDDPVGGFVNDNVACVSSLICREDRDEAFAMQARSGTGYFNSLMLRYLDSIQKPPGVPEWPNLIPEPTADDAEKGARAGFSVAGDPEDCARTVQKFADIGADQIILGTLSNVFAVEEQVRSMELFAEHVLGRFDTDPVHSTTRQREAVAV